MDTICATKSLTFRVENIPPETTPEQLKRFFNTEDQPHIQVRSIVNAVDNYDFDIHECTATISFQSPNQMIPIPRVIDDNISVDSEFHGFTPLHHPQEPVAADVIAVTGLAAHAFGSWAHSARSMWLRDYLPRDIPTARILIYGYPSQLHGSISRSILSDYSNNFILRLLEMRQSAKCEDRPIVFIGHSLGCLIIKKALCDINGSVGIFSSRLPVRSIIFLGAPHKGLQTTALETLVKSQPTEDMVRELKSESPTLTELNDKFRHVAKDVDILTCHEQNPTKTAIEMPDGSWKRQGPPTMMVSLDSAKLWYPREKLIACNADHSQIAKLKRGEGGIYPSVRWAIKQALLRAGDPYSEVKQPDPDVILSAEQSAELHPQVIVAASRTRGPKEPTTQDPIEGAQTANRWEEKQSPTLSRTPSVLRTEPASSANAHEITVPPGELLSSEAEEAPSSRATRSPSEKAQKKSMFYSEELREAIVNGNQDRTRHLLANEYDVNCKYEVTGGTPLLTAAAFRNEHLILLLLEGGADPRAKDSDGQTTLHRLASYQPDKPLTQSCIDLFFQRQPLINAKANRGVTPLMCAAAAGELELAKTLLKHGADIHGRDVGGWTPLHITAYFGKTPELDSLFLKEGADIEAKTEYGGTPLFWAAARNNAPNVALLLKSGANIEAPDSDGRTPLHYAAFKGHLLIVKVLLEYGANIEARDDRFKGTPLHHAAGEGQLAAIKALLDHGANIKARDHSKGTPLHNAAQSGQLEAIKALLEHGANIEAPDKNGLTPLYRTAYGGQLSAAKALLDHGANPFVKSSWFERTPGTARNAVKSDYPVKVELQTVLKEAEKKWKESSKSA